MLWLLPAANRCAPQLRELVATALPDAREVRLYDAVVAGDGLRVRLEDPAS